MDSLRWNPRPRAIEVTRRVIDVLKYEQQFQCDMCGKRYEAQDLAVAASLDADSLLCGACVIG